MANNGVKITAPVSVEDVMVVLGVNNYDVGYLCSNYHHQINKWAKYKPVCFPNRYDSTLNTYKAGDNMCGLKITTEYLSINDFIAAVKSPNPLSGWDYVPPTGGDNAPYRLTDFDGYDDKARSPFGYIPEGSEFYTSQAGTRIDALMPFASAGSLSLSDFLGEGHHFGDWYFGVLLYGVGTNHYIATSEETIGSGSINAYVVNIPNSLQASDFGWMCVPFIASGKITSSGTASNLKIIAIENKGVDVVIKSPGGDYSVGIRAYYSSATEITVTITVRNNSSAAISVTNGLISVSTTNSGNGQTLKSGVTLSVSAKSNKSESYTIGVSRNDWKYAKFSCSIKGNNVDSGWVGFMVAPGSGGILT